MKSKTSRQQGQYAINGSVSGGGCDGRLLLTPHCPPPNVRQEHNWDCGVAVVASVLCVAQERPVDLRAVFPLLPRGAVETRSVWSVDLIYALRKGGVRGCCLTTTSDGVNPDHAGLEFYKEAFDHDEKRVSALIAGAEAAGVLIRKV